jgi:hypothetical protein
MQSNLVHEFAHCVTLHVNRAPPTTSLAVGERGDLRGAAVGGSARRELHDGARSAVVRIDDCRRQHRIYDVGYSIAEFIVSRWGQSALSQLVAASGDTRATLDVPLTDFQRQWFAFARERYGF